MILFFLISIRGIDLYISSYKTATKKLLDSIILNDLPLGNFIRNLEFLSGYKLKSKIILRIIIKMNSNYKWQARVIKIVSACHFPLD